MPALYGLTSRLLARTPSCGRSSGVKQLEELLVKSETLSSSTSSRTDDNNTDASRGFVSLKQLRWLLSEHFGLDVRETALMESCLGMNFNARAQIDHREFTHVLLDILLYAPPHASAATAQLLFAAIREYMASGFDARDDAMNRETLTALCAKYDLERGKCVSVAELMRVLFTDLPKRHALHMAFPLTQQDALRIIQPFVLEHSGDTTTRADGARAMAKPAFVSYPAFLAAIFAQPDKDSEVDADALAMQALDARFWVQLCKALCSGNRALESSIHVQLCKIFRKIDPKRHFVVTQRTFARILDQHLSVEQLRVVCAALALPLDTSSRRHHVQRHEQPIATSASETSDGHHDQSRDPNDVAAAPLRFDVFMKLVFGAPALQDTAFFRERIVSRLQQHEAAIRARVVALLKAHGGAFKTTPRTLHNLVNGKDKSQAKASMDSALPMSDAVLTPCELLYVFASIDDAHEGRVTLQTLWTFLKTECWRTCDVPSHTTRHGARLRSTSDDPEGPGALARTKRALAQCLDAYNLERALERYKHEHHGSISQDQLLKEIYRMLHALGQDDDSDALDPARLQQLLASIAAEIHDVDADLAASKRLHLTIPIDALFDALVDWDALVRALQLPHNLADVKRTLEVFDWSRDGTIAAADWPKAWRMVSARSKAMGEWEVRALQRRFPAATGTSSRRSRALGDDFSKPKRSWSRESPSDADSESDAAINYAQLLVHLMDRQHEHTRRRMQALVFGHFRAFGTLSHRLIEQLYRRIDVADKGHINLSDLQQYVAAHVIQKLPVRSGSGDDNDDQALVQNVNVMSCVLQSLASSNTRSRDTGALRASTVTRSHFHSFMERLAAPTSPQRRVGGHSSRSHSSSKRGRHGQWQLNSIDMEDSGDASSSSSLRHAPRPQVLTSLRALELVILDICSAVARAPDGGILPTKAFRYLSTGATDDSGGEESAPHSPRARSPTRRASRASSRSPVRQQGPQRGIRRSHSPVSSMTMRSQYHEVEAMRLDPLTPSTLQRVLLDCYDVDASHMLVTQFFEHIGARSKRLLELVVFAKWVAPLSVATTAAVRTAVKQMVLRGKGGGGRVDLDRFFAQLERKLLDAPSFESGDAIAATVLRVPLPLLHTTLQQLGILLSRSDMETLVRHVGMEEETGAIDVALFLQRIVETSGASTTS